MSAVSDTFDRANSAVTLGSAETGQAWGVSPATTWGISSNKAYCPVLGAASVWPGPAGHATVDPALVDQIVQCDITAMGPASAALGIMGRYVGIQDFWTAFVLNTGGSPFLYCGKVVAGANTYGVVNALALSAGPWTLKLTFVGNDIKVYLNGVQQGAVTDAFNNTATKSGLLAGNAASQGVASFDNFSVVSPKVTGDLMDEMLRSLRTTYAAPTGSLQDLSQRFKADHNLKGQDSQHAFFGGSGSFNDDALHYWLNH